MSELPASYAAPAPGPGEGPRLLPPAPNSLSLLVNEFAKVLNEKLQAAAIKYGYQADQWLDPTWRTDCIEDLLLHIDKGDPRDVAAYCAFAWYHGWSLTPATTLAQMADQRNEARAHAAAQALELATLRKAVQLAADALASCYDATDYPASGASTQDTALKAIQSALAGAPVTGEGKEPSNG